MNLSVCHQILTLILVKLVGNYHSQITESRGKNTMILNILLITFIFWVLFFGGAEKIENSFVAYLGFGRFGEKSGLIKALVCASVALYLFKVNYS